MRDVDKPDAGEPAIPSAYTPKRGFARTDPSVAMPSRAARKHDVVSITLSGGVRPDLPFAGRSYDAHELYFPVGTRTGSAHDIDRNFHRDGETARECGSVRFPGRLIARILGRILKMRAVRCGRKLIVKPFVSARPQIDPHFVIGAITDVVGVLTLQQHFALFDVEPGVDKGAVGKDARGRSFRRRSLMLHVPS